MTSERKDRSGNEPASPGDSPDRESPGAGERVSRRSFLRGAVLTAGAAAVPAKGLLAREESAPAELQVLGPGPVPIVLTVNGKELKLQVEPRVTLLDALRDGMDLGTSRPVDLTGSKRVCDRGSCGACTVIIDGRTAYACTVLAVEAQGKKIETIEGIAGVGKPHPLQESFVRKDALMCGFCTPGFVLSAKNLLDRNPYPSREEIRRSLGGHICRCGTYNRIFEAVEDASERMGSAEGE